MAAWSLRPSALDIQLQSERASGEAGLDGSVLPPVDYFIKQAGGLENDDDPFDLKNNGPVARSLVESSNRFFVERNLFSHLNTTFQPRTTNHFNDEEIEIESMTYRPQTFIFLGKPGVGKTIQATKLAEKLNCVYISPESIISHYKNHDIPSAIRLENMDGTLSHEAILALTACRIMELDVFHKGYVMDGFPLIRSTEVSVKDQLHFIASLPMKPHHIIILNMQDLDLFKRRRDQKFDPMTSIVYTRDQYIHKQIFDPVPVPRERRDPIPSSSQKEEDDDEEEPPNQESQESFENSEMGSSQDLEGIEPFIETGDDAPDFEPLAPHVIKRLITRPDDLPSNVAKDFSKFREARPHIQAFIDSFDRRRVLQLNSYWQPSIIFKMILEFTDNFGASTAPTPVRLISNLENPGMFQVIPEDFYDSDELGEEAPPCIPFEDVFLGEVDWDAALRAVTVRSRVDPRFRWRISHWKNVCPVALKHGNTVIGRPELAIGFMDKVYFLSSDDAVKQFEFNPRPYLLPTMPTSPIKFFIIGHPLAGKTLFANKLAQVAGGYVIDMKRQLRKRYEVVKADYLFRARLEGTYEITKSVDREQFDDWKRLERHRRVEVLKWIERFIRMKANTELNAMLELEQDDRRKLRQQLRAASEFHTLGEIYSGSCRSDASAGVGFTWTDFVQAMREGHRNFSHQQKLELAWDLFHKGILRYKINKNALRRLIKRERPKDDVEEEEDIELDGEGLDFGGLESAGESGSGDSIQTPLRRRRRRRRKRQICAPKKPMSSDSEEELVRVESVESSVFGSDDEPDESIRLRFPEIPASLIEGIPRPSNVSEKHPLVLDRLEQKMAEAELWADSSPPELYTEVLKLYTQYFVQHTIAGHTYYYLGAKIHVNEDALMRMYNRGTLVLLDLEGDSRNRHKAIAEIEERYLRKFPRGPLSGGWIVENLALDIEKWRMILRTPETKPDNVVILQDNVLDHPFLLRNLKQAHKNAKPRRFVEYPGEDFGEDGIIPLAPLLRQSEMDMSMTDFIVNCLPIDELGLGNVTDWENDPTVLTKLRTASLADSILGPTQKKILGDWLETFDSTEKTNEQEPDPDPSRPQSLMLRTQNASQTIWSDDEPELDWNPRQIKYEMLSVYQYRSESPQVESASQVLVRARTRQEILQEIGGESEVPRAMSLFNLGGEDQGEDSPTPRSLLSLEDILCAPESGPEDPPCTPFTHEPSLKRTFEHQIQVFDEFYNMVHTLLQKDYINIRKWQIGIIDAENASNKAVNLYEELEKRFDYVAVRVSPSDLKEMSDEWKDANKIWGMIDKDNVPDDDEYGFESDDETELEGEEDDGIPAEYRKYKDPEEYLKAVIENEKLIFYGDLKDFCPVTLYHSNALRRGQYAAKWQDRIYYMQTPEFLNLFLESPAKFLPTTGPLPVPPPRICVTGSPGCGQEEVALKVAMEHNIYYVNLRQRIHEVLKVKLGRDIGPGQASTILGNSMIGRAPSSNSVDQPRRPFYSDEEEGEFGDDANRRLQQEIDSLALQNFGIEKPINVSACRATELDRTEKLAERDWNNTVFMESSIREFLEYGEQLSEEVLNEFVAPLFNDEPYRSKGFVLVGFPNTASDIEWLINHKYFPEYVHILDSKSRTMRNRLVLKTVADWKKLNPEKKQRKSLGRGTAQRQARVLSEQDKDIIMNEYMPLPVSDDEEKANKWKVQKDVITERVTSSLLHYHRIYSRGLRGLMMQMNRSRVSWNVIHTDLSLNESKRTLTERLSNAMKYRTSMFEATFELSFKEAAALIDRAYFRLSKFGRFCPVEVFKGNTTVNLWNAPGVIKYPFLYRDYIYYVAGPENAKLFRQNVWDIVKQRPPTPTMPLYIIINGPPKSGKTELATRIANKLGLIYISQEQVITDTVRHSFLNQDYDFDMSPANLMSGPLSMALADEILAYLRGGYLVPQYMFYRAMDLSLMAPRAQFHGAVFDDYPMEEEQLQELLERGIVPSVVVNLKMDPTEGYRRADTRRFNSLYNYDNFTEDCNGFMDYIVEDYLPSIDPCLEWYQNEIQCLLNVDATQSPTMIFEQVKSKCLDTMTKMQRYILAVLSGLPAVLSGTSPLTSLLHAKLSQSFGIYDSVALNETNELIRVNDLTDLSRIIEYHGELYAFSCSRHVDMFMAEPEKYTYPNCLRLPPVEVPVSCILTDQETSMLKDHWGFVNFDPVFYVEGNMQFKWLKECNGKFCVEYRERLYFFLSANNMEKFLRQPHKYINIPMPTKFPGKSTRPLDSLPPSGYVIATGLTQQLSQMLGVIGSKRPKFPFMSNTRSGLLYLGYYLKTLNNNNSPQLRKHYRRAMAHMSRTQHLAENLQNQIQKIHGNRHVPTTIKKRLDTYMLLANRPDKEKVVDPSIPGLEFNFEAVPSPEQTNFNNILAEFLKQRCEGSGDWEEEQAEECEVVICEDEEELQDEDEADFKEPSVIDLDKYVVPAYLAKDRLM